MLIGYVRVSSVQQNEDRQLIALREYGVAKRNIFIDKQSGKDFNRANYRKMYGRLKKGDVLIIKSIDRLGRSYKDILHEWRKITKIKCADIKVLDIELLDTTKHKDLLGTFICDLVLQLLSYISENERINIRQRQAEGISAAKKRGVKFGRPKRIDPEDFREIYELRKNKKITQKEAVMQMGVCNKTYYKIMKCLEKGDTQ